MQKAKMGRFCMHLDMAFAKRPANKHNGNIHIKANVVLGEPQKAVRYGQGQPGIWTSLKTSSFPLLPYSSMIPPKEGHPEDHFWKCIGNK